MTTLLPALLACLLGAAVPPAGAADTLRVIVIDGAEAANIVAERIAAEPVIEVRDKDDRRVPGAVVRFVIRKTRDRLLAVFRNGQPEVRTLTDASGRASANAVTPLESGRFQIDVEVRYRGQTGKATLRHTNFATRADAQSAGRDPGKSTNANAQSAATNAAASGAASAAGSSAAVVPSASIASGGGGISKLAVAGLVAGGAAGAGAAVVLARRESEPPATVAPIVSNQAVGIHTATPFTFSVQATGFEASTLNYQWEFGDGATSTDPAPTHVYETPGTYAVAVTVRDARQSARSEMSVTVLALTGTWVSDTGRTTLYLSQSGTAITGSGDFTGLSPTTGVQTLFTGCAVSGSVERAVPVPLSLTSPGCRHESGAFLRPARFSLTVASDGRTLNGVLSSDGQPDLPAILTRQ